ncbi:MAG: O-antigen ligase family protein [Candidatus Andersenbacteria bacterium]
MNTASVHLLLGGSAFVVFMSALNGGALHTTLSFVTILWLFIVLINTSRRQQDIFGFVLIGLLAIFAQWGVLQFSLQQDLGLQYIGESNIGPSVPAVAKFFSEYNDIKLIRAYGPYPHSNPYGGAALVGLLLLPYFTGRYSGQHGRYLRILEAVLTGVFCLAVFLSFSRAAIAGVLILFILSWARRRQAPGPVLNIRILGLAIVTLLLLFSPLLYSRNTDTEDVALVDRVSGIEWSMNIIREHPLLGVGPGNYTAALEGYLVSENIPVNNWEVAPVHSVPLLLASEWGLLTSISILAFVAWLMRRSVGQLTLITFPLFPLLLLDHFYYTQVFLLLLLIFTGWFLLSRRNRTLNS